MEAAVSDAPPVGCDSTGEEPDPTAAFAPTKAPVECELSGATILTATEADQPSPPAPAVSAIDTDSGTMVPETAEPHIQPTDAIDPPVDPAEVSGEQTPYDQAAEPTHEPRLEPQEGPGDDCPQPDTAAAAARDGEGEQKPPEGSGERHPQSDTATAPDTAISAVAGAEDHQPAQDKEPEPPECLGGRHPQSAPSSIAPASAPATDAAAVAEADPQSVDEERETAEEGAGERQSDTNIASVTAITAVALAESEPRAAEEESGSPASTAEQSNGAAASATSAAMADAVAAAEANPLALDDDQHRESRLQEESAERIAKPEPHGFTIDAVVEADIRQPMASDGQDRGSGSQEGSREHLFHSNPP